jgi:hypothetical protein
MQIRVHTRGSLLTEDYVAYVYCKYVHTYVVYVAKYVPLVNTNLRDSILVTCNELPSWKKKHFVCMFSGSDFGGLTV